MEPTGLVTIKSARGINSLVAEEGKEPISPRLYKQKEKNRKEGGEFISEYNDLPFPSSKKFFCPMWDQMRKSWSWSADGTMFKKTVEELLLKYEGDHPQRGEFIKAGDVERHKKDFNDPIFNHSNLLAKAFMVGGKGTLNMEIPLERFMYYCNNGRRSVVDENVVSFENVNPLVRTSATLVMSNPKRASIQKRKNTDTILGAMGAINDAKADVKRLRAYATLFSIPGLGPSSDANEIVNTLTEYVSEYGTEIQKGSGYNSLNEALIAHSKMDETELQMRYALALAKNRGLIKTSKDGFMLLGNMVTGPTSMDEIYKYFTSADEKAGDNLILLLEKLKTLNQL
jgi:hypothetical protein